MYNNLKKEKVHIACLWLFEDISGDGVKACQIFDGGDILRDSFDHHLTGWQHQLMGSHLRNKKNKNISHM